MLRLLDSSPALGGKLCATKLREDGICLKQKINWRRTNEDDGNNLIILALRNSILRHLHNLMLKKKKGETPQQQPVCASLTVFGALLAMQESF